MGWLDKPLECGDHELVVVPVCRHYRLEAELLAEVNWRVRWNDIRFGDSASDARRTHGLERNGSRYSRVCTYRLD